MNERSGFISFGFRLFLYILAGIIFSDALLLYVTDQNLGKAYYETLVVLEAFKNSSYRITYSVSSFIQMAFTLVVVAGSLLMSHRIAGPMYRFEKVAESVRDGDLGVSVILRDNDYLKNQAEEFSLALDNMRGVLAAVKDKADELERLSGGLSDGGERGSAIKAMSAEVEELRAGLGYFKS